MNDAVRAAVNARLHEKHMTRADLARATGLKPSAVTRALNGLEGGGSLPPSWAAILDALGLTLTALPVEYVSGGPVTLPSDPAALEREVMSRVQAAVREVLASHGTPPAEAPGSAGGEG
jgi:transcriptional regulator with XRE-family HTH domain